MSPNPDPLTPAPKTLQAITIAASALKSLSPDAQAKIHHLTQTSSNLSAQNPPPTITPSLTWRASVLKSQIEILTAIDRELERTPSGGWSSSSQEEIERERLRDRAAGERDRLEQERGFVLRQEQFIKEDGHHEFAQAESAYVDRLYRTFLSRVTKGKSEESDDENDENDENDETDENDEGDDDEDNKKDDKSNDAQEAK